MKPQRLAPAIVAALAVVALLGGVHLLREATQSTHYATGPDTRLEVLVVSRIHGSEPTQTLDEITEAHLSSCRLEVTSDVESIASVPGTRPRQYRVVLRPALDSSDRKQFEGCIEDWNLDQNEIEVLSIHNFTKKASDDSSTETE